ncbi:MAG: hypothetical protein HLX50_14055 [Alteromonadaceae bacterium]|nr:hypothetical protein [Alteromonadaceae bacterium]
MNDKKIIIFGLLLLCLGYVVPGTAKAQDSCSYVDINTAKDLGEASTHCVTLPIYKNTPLVFVQYETSGKSYNRFEVKLMSSSASNAGVVD